MTSIQGKRQNEELDDYFELESTTKRSKGSKAKKIQEFLFVGYDQEAYETYPLPNTVLLSHKSMVKIGNPSYIQIGRYVVPVMKSYQIAEDKMTLFEHFKTTLIDNQPGEQSNLSRQVCIQPYDINQASCAQATAVRFKVLPWRTFDYIGKSKYETTILEDVLRLETSQQLGNQIVRIGQVFFLKHPIVGPLKLVVLNCDIENSNDIDLLDATSQPEFGILTPNTYFSFKTGDKNKIVIVEECDSTLIQEFCVKIVKVKEVAQKGFATSLTQIQEKDWQRGLEPLPLIVPLEDLKFTIKSVWEGKLIYPDKKVKFHHGERKFTVQFSMARVANDVKTNPLGKNLKAFRLNNDHYIKVDSGTNVILTASAKSAQPATELTFKICGWKKEFNPEQNQLIWFNVDAIIRHLRGKLSYLPLNSKCSVALDGHHLLLELVNAKGLNTGNIGGAKQLWKVEENTVFSFFVPPKRHMELVHATIRFPINSMQVVVSRKEKEAKNLFDKKEPLPKVSLNEAAIVEAFNHAVPADGFLSEKKVIHGITKTGIKLTFKIRQIQTSVSNVKPDGYGFLHKYNPQTKVTWMGEMNGNVMIERPIRQVETGKIHEELIEAGLGGLPKELEQVILEIKLSRGEYNNYMKDLGIAPTRGIILWGPPGTGKTQIARNLGKILGISEERTQLYTGSEIWDKYVGNSEKNVVKMFAAAREEQNRLGEKSQMHLLIIDEIDAFLQKRDTAKNRWETSVITTFLAQLDGITSNGKDPLNNIIVIGMTNQPHTIDEAVKREGRLGTHIHIGLPDHQGRKDIFMIHSKKLIAKGSLAPDVDFDKLAELSSGKTGAYIEGIVAKAAKYHVTKLQEAKITPADAGSHPLAKVAMADFKQSLKETTSSSKADKKKEDFVPIEGDSLEVLSDNLRRLGIVGVPGEAMEFIRDCKISQSYKKLELPSAVLLYGNAGTGKSSIARSLEKLLALDGNRFKHLSASQLWPKRGADLKESIGAIIQPAKNASRDLGKGAPLHVIVIDEIDWIYTSNQFSEKESGAMMGQFLREIQNLFQAEGYDATNLMIIGIASGNVPVEILKGFNIGTSAKLVEVKLPNYKERKVILNYYLEEFINEKRIEENTINELVEMAKDKPGSFLKVWVKEAVNKMYRRAAENRIPEEQLSKHPMGRLLLDDFRGSYSTLAGEEKWKSVYC